jgi:hypothetical protein
MLILICRQYLSVGYCACYQSNVDIIFNVTVHCRSQSRNSLLLASHLLQTGHLAAQPSDLAASSSTARVE